MATGSLRACSDWVQNCTLKIYIFKTMLVCGRNTSARTKQHRVFQRNKSNRHVTFARFREHCMQTKNCEFKDSYRTSIECLVNRRICGVDDGNWVLFEAFGNAHEVII